METKIALATQNGYALFQEGQVQYVEEARDASTFSDRHSATKDATKHGLTEGFILVDVSAELAKAGLAA